MHYSWEIMESIFGPICRSVKSQGIMVGMRLFAVTRRDLAPEAQASQVCRAVMQFGCIFPELGKLWFEGVNLLSIPMVGDAAALRRFWGIVHGEDIRAVAMCVREPPGCMAVIVMETTAHSKRLVARLW